MTPSPESSSRTPQTVPEAVVRILRHEVSNLLQTVYAAVAILHVRLPPGMDAERRILGDMRVRAETCRDLLDTLHDLVAPILPELEDVDVAEVAEPLVTRAATRAPSLTVRFEQAPAPRARADGRRVAQLVGLLLSNACAAAARDVVVRVGPGPEKGEVTLTVLDDGLGVAAELTDRLFDAHTTTASGHLGPGLPLARRIVHLHGGRVTAGNRAEGGFRVDVVLPAALGLLPLA